jgi:hypothetical protein
VLNRDIFHDRAWNCGSRQADQGSGKAHRPRPAKARIINRALKPLRFPRCVQDRFQRKISGMSQSRRVVKCQHEHA